MAREVIDPHGVRWRVRRRWLVAPVSPRWRGGESLLDGGTPDLDLDVGDGIVGVIAAILAIVALAAIIAFVLLPLAILLVEILIFVVLAGIGLAGRVLLRRPWALDADADAPGPDTRFTWHVAGWRSSREAIGDIAAGLRRGERPPRPAGLPAPQRR